MRDNVFQNNHRRIETQGLNRPEYNGLYHIDATMAVEDRVIVFGRSRETSSANPWFEPMSFEPHMLVDKLHRRVCIVNDGRILEEGMVNENYLDHELVYSSFLGMMTMGAYAVSRLWNIKEVIEDIRGTQRYLREVSQVLREQGVPPK